MQLSNLLNEAGDLPKPNYWFIIVYYFVTVTMTPQTPLLRESGDNERGVKFQTSSSQMKSISILALLRMGLSWNYTTCHTRGEKATHRGIWLWSSSDGYASYPITISGIWLTLVSRQTLWLHWLEREPHESWRERPQRQHTYPAAIDKTRSRERLTRVVWIYQPMEIKFDLVIGIFC